MSTDQTSVQVFKFAHQEEAFRLRVVTIDDQPWFAVSDVCRACGVANPAQAAARLDTDEKRIVPITSTYRKGGGPRNVIATSTSGVFALVLGSRKPQATPFKRWLCREVLPSISRTGHYTDTAGRMGETISEATGGAIRVDPPAPAASIDIGAAFAAFTATLQEQNEIARRNEAALTYSLNSLRRDFTQTIGRIVRMRGAQRTSTAGQRPDPNRPLDDEDVERLKFMLATGRTLREVARTLGRSFETIGKFVNANTELVRDAIGRQLI